MRTFYFDISNHFYVKNEDGWENADWLSTLNKSIGKEVKIYRKGLYGLEEHHGELMFVFKESYNIYVVVIKGGDEFMGINDVLDKLEDNPEDDFLKELALAWIDRFSANADTTQIEKRYNEIVE